MERRADMHPEHGMMQGPWGRGGGGTSSVVRLSFERVPQAYTRRVCAAIAASRQFAAWRVVPRPLLARLHMAVANAHVQAERLRPAQWRAIARRKLQGIETLPPHNNQTSRLQ